MASLAFARANANLKKVREGQSDDFPSPLFQFWGRPQAPKACLLVRSPDLFFKRPLVKWFKKTIEE